MRADELAAGLGLKPHEEGGSFMMCNEDSDKDSGVILYYLGPGQFSQFHMMEQTEEHWCIHAGTDLEIWIADPDTGAFEVRRLGYDDGARLSLKVPGKMIMGIRHADADASDGTLVSCITVPRFTEERIYSVDEIRKSYPYLMSFYR